MSFQAPVGTAEERAAGKIWPGNWVDATPFLTKYAIGIHPGADLNLGADADAHSPIYAIGDGVVTYAQRYPNPNVWGNIIVINHGTVDSRPLFSRYAHVEDMIVNVGQSVRMGDRIAKVGNGFGLFAYHLHFDISNTEILLAKPWNWPAPSTNPDPSAVKAHYVDPKKWLQDHFAASGISTVITDTTTGIGTAGHTAVVDEGPVSGLVRFVIATAGLNVRDKPRTSATKRGTLPSGARVTIETKTVKRDSYLWGQLSSGADKGRWIALGTADQKEMFVSEKPPAN